MSISCRRRSGSYSGRTPYFGCLASIMTREMNSSHSGGLQAILLAVVIVFAGIIGAFGFMGDFGQGSLGRAQLVYVGNQRYGYVVPPPPAGDNGSNKNDSAVAQCPAKCDASKKTCQNGAQATYNKCIKTKTAACNKLAKAKRPACVKKAKQTCLVSKNTAAKKCASTLILCQQPCSN